MLLARHNFEVRVRRTFCPGTSSRPRELNTLYSVSRRGLNQKSIGCSSNSELSVLYGGSMSSGDGDTEMLARI